MAIFSKSLENALRRALQIAIDHRHEYVTLETMLLGLIDDSDALNSMRQCGANLTALREAVSQYMRDELSSIVVEEGIDPEPRPTAGFQRVLQRAMLKADAAGEPTIDGGAVLLALLSERDSHAVYFLSEQQVTISRVTSLSSGSARTIDNVASKIAALEQQLSVAIARITDLEKEVAEARAGIPASARREGPDVFVSYRREQKELVRVLVERLRTEGLMVWWDVDIPAGAPWEATIEKQISSAKVVVVCWSWEACGSDNVKAEARYGRDRNKLIQVFLDGCDAPIFFGERQGLKFDGWTGDVAAESYRLLLEGIRAQL